MNQEIIPAYRAYQKVIDLTLYHAFAELIVQMAQDDEVRILYRQQEVRQIWQRDQNVSGYFETYSLRYPGEVLERFEEKLGTDMRILRALALALGYTRQCQADTMFVGNQRNDFIQKLRRTAGTDVYLQGALYLLETDAPQRRARLDELAAREYARTEEALFVLSLFDDPEQQEQEDARLEREKRRQQAVLAIRKKYGKNAILKGMNLEEGATARDRNRQIGGHKA